jgi:Chaperone of endosialidase
MARYNTVSATGTTSTGTTLNSPGSGLLTTFTGTAPYTVTVPNPVLYAGQAQTFYNATSGVVTIQTPNGVFSGPTGSGSTQQSVNAGEILTIVSDGTNYLIQTTAGGPVTITAGTINGTTLGATTPSSATFTTLSATSNVTFTGGVASTSTSTGTLQVTGGVGITGALFTGAATHNGTLTVSSASIVSGTAGSTVGSILMQGYYTNGALANWGTEYSTGGPVMSYGATPSTSASAAFVSSSAGTNLSRGAYTISGNTHNWYSSSGNTTVAVGTSVTMPNLMTLTSSGYLGLNTVNNSITTATPLHIYTTQTAADQIRIQNSVLTLNIGLNNSATGGAGSYVFEGSSNALRFGTNNTEAGRFDASQNFLIGYTSNSSLAGQTPKLNVNGYAGISGLRLSGADPGNTIYQSNSSNMSIVIGGAYQLGFGVSGSNTNFYINSSGNCVTSGSLTVGTTITENSSITLKENVQPISNALDSILKLAGVTYDRRDGSNKDEPGLIAEEVYKIIPNLVSKNEKGEPFGIQYTKLTAYLIESIKELNAEITKLKRINNGTL